MPSTEIDTATIASPPVASQTKPGASRLPDADLSALLATQETPTR
jgi:hypothetical protein